MVRDRGKASHVGLGKRKWNDEGTSSGVDVNPDISCLLPKHKIFLSHSGKQKWFVEKLCEDLEASCRFPFFDKRPSSLPEGERFAELIFKAAEQCELAVVVVSEEYLTTKWPMLELKTFVQALSALSGLKPLNPDLKILPLFFGLSVRDLRCPSTFGLQVWDEWAREDKRIIPEEFQDALKVMRKFHGIKFNGDMDNLWSFENKVVRSICRIVAADVKREDSDVQGRSTICEVTREKIKVVGPSEKNGICVFGYYGVGGIGKTTTCKTLCNELFEFSSKVCHIELGGTKSEEQMLKHVLKELTSTNEELLKRLDKDQCQNILKNPKFWRQKTFLAIDNVWDDNKSMDQAQMFLDEPAFHKGSVVMVTSRFPSTLVRLGICEQHCFEAPELEEVDAKKLFLHHAARKKQFDSDEDIRVIGECLERCLFQKSEKRGFHYLPLALKELGKHLRRSGDSPAKWSKALPTVRDFNRFPGDNPVFSIIRLNYDRLSVRLQALFLDVAVFRPSMKWGEYVAGGIDSNYFDWLSVVHGQNTQSLLQQLKESGVLEDVDIDSERVSVHDVYREFAKMEVEGKLNSSVDFESRRWVYSKGSYPSDLENPPYSGSCWAKLIRLGIQVRDEDPGADFDLHGIQLGYCSKLVVLKLKVLAQTTGVLNLEGLRCLRSLELVGMGGIDGVEGLKDLNNLRYFCWDGHGNHECDYGSEDECRAHEVELKFSDDEYKFSDDEYSDNAFELSDDEHEFSRSSYLGQLPASLEILYVYEVDVCLRSDVFHRCRRLHTLLLSDIRASDSLDFNQCSSLQSVHLVNIRGLRKFFGLAAGLQSCVQSVVISRCQELYNVSGLGDLVRLRSLSVRENPSLNEFHDLQKLTSLKFLSFFACAYGPEVRGLGSLGGLRQLRELYLGQLHATELPNLSALKCLRVLYLWVCKNLTTLDGVAGLIALRRVEVLACPSLSRLPDLSNSTNLETLQLSSIGSGIELHEEDIDMLAALPRLRPVRFDWYIHLHPVRRKMVIGKYVGSTLVEVEKNLESFPIKTHRDALIRDYID